MREGPSEYQPSRATITIVVVLVAIAVSAFGYYCYRLVERQRITQSAPAAPITTPEPEPSATVGANKKREPQVYVPPAEVTTPEPQEFVASEPAPVQSRCDGRTRCSQMTSCDEAKFFVKNCPGVQMDGDGDGIPCEQQWCGSRF